MLKPELNIPLECVSDVKIRSSSWRNDLLLSFPQQPWKTKPPARWITIGQTYKYLQKSLSSPYFQFSKTRHAMYYPQSGSYFGYRYLISHNSDYWFFSKQTNLQANTYSLFCCDLARSLRQLLIWRGESLSQSSLLLPLELLETSPAGCLGSHHYFASLGPRKTVAARVVGVIEVRRSMTRLGSEAAGFEVTCQPINARLDSHDFQTQAGEALGFLRSVFNS